MSQTAAHTRVDAQVSDLRSGLGGWFPTRGSEGEVSVVLNGGH